MTNSGATYNEEINTDKTIDYYSTHFDTMIQDVKNHKTMMKQNNINIGDKSLEKNYKNLEMKMKNFYNLIENDTNNELERYEKNYLLLYNIYTNDIKKYQGNSENSNDEQEKMLNKRKAYYTSQELYKRNTSIYYFQSLYFLIYLVFIVECLRSSVIGLVSKIILIILFGMMPYLTYHVIIPWYYRYQINSDKYNVIKNVHMED